MTQREDPVEPTQVYDASRPGTRERARRAASWLRTNSESAYRRADERTRGLRANGRQLGERVSRVAADAARTGGPIDRTEERINGALSSVSRQIDGRAEQAAGFIRTGVTRSAAATRRLLRGRSGR
ncbi:hypothetical protein GSY69_02705 [Brevibacterium sp. 5221]|uniref:Uncharacterized protein n=1 Tax=Brevibacterium rongguiense TaxID=2695267 RepID=A0A6N9H4D5_9MICO|nr:MULTISPECIES: hypothetical protein [Brevibacterium]MYM18918.1 hypothetical protein [Brevibacterium rongguiense]WAL40765.1 hypothetical protein BRM1_02525 [Brevibacterium sp. BRM-1]